MRIQLSPRARPIILFDQDLRCYYLQLPERQFKFEVSQSVAHIVAQQYYGYRPRNSCRLLYASPKTIVIRRNGMAFKRDARTKQWRTLKLIPGNRLDLLSLVGLSRAKLRKLLTDLRKQILRLHATRAYHGDIHPGNILYDRKTANVNLIDRLCKGEALSGAPGFRPRGRRPRTLKGLQRRDLFALSRVEEFVERRLARVL